MTRLFKWLAFALVLMAISCYALADGRPLFGSIMVGLSLVGIWLTESRARRPLPRLVILSLVSLALANAAWAATSGRLTVSAFAEFVTYLQVIKLFDRRRARDYAQLLSLAIFQIIGAILTSNSLAVGLIVMVFVPCIAVCASLQQVYVASESTRQPASGGIHGKRASRDLMAVSAVCTLGAVVGGVAAFLFIPRGLGTQRMGEWGNVSLGQTTSFTDSVTLGVGGLITESHAEVLDMEVTDRSGQNLGASDRIYYLRGAALDLYRSGRWAASQSDRIVRNPLEADRTVPVGGVPADVTHITRITIRNASDPLGYLFTLWQPSRVTFVGTRGVLEIGPNGVLRRESPPGRFDYIIHSIVDTSGRSRGSDGDRSREIISERAATLADEVLRDAEIEPDPTLRPPDEDLRAAKALERFLRMSYGYTMDILAPRSGEEPIDFFLFDARQGHCEYFASALAAMCRAVGIRTRVVTGYVAAEFNEGAGRYIVRESNAHAWVEAMVGAGRWVTLDATPPADLSRIHAPSLGTLARIRRAFDAIELAWIDRIVGFDERQRASVIGVQPVNSRSVEDRVADMNLRMSSGGLSLVARALRNGLLVFAGMGMVGAGLVIIFRTLHSRLALLRMLKRAQRTRPDLAAALSGAEFFADMQALLAARGHGRPVWLGALEHAVRVERESESAPRLTPLVRLYYKARFGRHPLTPEESGEGSRGVSKLRRTLQPMRRTRKR